MKKFVSLLILFAVLLAACAPQTQAQPATGHYAGQVEGSEAFIGLVTNGKQLQAYFCDGTEQAAPVLWGWFRGDLNGTTFDLTNEKGDRLAGEFSTNDVSGTITLAEGTQLSFRAEKVNQPAGLYRLEETIDGVDTLSGWVVLANGHWRGGRKSGARLTSAGQPTGWVDPDFDPISWVDPDPDPWIEPDTQP